MNQFHIEVAPDLDREFLTAHEGFGITEALAGVGEIKTVEIIHLPDDKTPNFKATLHARDPQGLAEMFSNKAQIESLFKSTFGDSQISMIYKPDRNLLKLTVSN